MLGNIFHHASCVVTLVHRFGPDWIISKSTGRVPTKFWTAIHCPLLSLESSDFYSSATMSLNLDIYWMYCNKIFHVFSRLLEDESSWLWWSYGFSSGATMRFIFVVLSEISQQLLDGHTWNAVHTSMSCKNLGDTLVFSSGAIIGSKFQVAKLMTLCVSAD